MRYLRSRKWDSRETWIYRKVFLGRGEWSGRHILGLKHFPFGSDKEGPLEQEILRFEDPWMQERTRRMISDALPLSIDLLVRYGITRAFHVGYDAHGRNVTGIHRWVIHTEPEVRKEYGT